MVGMEEFIDLLPKLVVGFILMLLYIHLSGKGSLAPISNIDQVGNVVLGALIGGALFNPRIDLFAFTASVIIWSGLMLFIRFLSNRYMEVKNVVDGEAVCLMRDGELQTGNFLRAELSVRDFTMLLHQRGFHNLTEINNVWFEYNGQLTVDRKGDENTATALIENGEINNEHLRRLKFTHEWLLAELHRREIKLSDVFYAEWHDQQLWIYPKQVEPSHLKKEG